MSTILIVLAAWAVGVLIVLAICAGGDVGGD